MRIKKIDNVYGIKEFKGDIKIFDNDIIYASNGTCKTSLIKIIENLFRGADFHEYKDRLNGVEGNITLEINGQEIDFSDPDFKSKVEEQTKSTFLTTIDEEKIAQAFNLTKNKKFLLNRRLYSDQGLTVEELEVFDKTQEIIELLSEKYFNINDIEENIKEFIRVVLNIYDEDDINKMAKGIFGHKKIGMLESNEHFKNYKNTLAFKEDLKVKWDSNQILKDINVLSLSKNKIPANIEAFKEELKKAFNPDLITNELYIKMNDEFLSFDEYWEIVNNEIDIISTELTIGTDVIKEYYDASQKITTKKFADDIGKISSSISDAESEKLFENLIKKNNKIIKIANPIDGQKNEFDKLYEIICWIFKFAETKGFNRENNNDSIIEYVILAIEENYTKVLNGLNFKIDIKEMEKSAKMFQNFKIELENNEEELLFGNKRYNVEFKYKKVNLNNENFDYLSEGEKTFALILINFFIAQAANEEKVIFILDDTGDRLDSKNKHMFMGMMKEAFGYLSQIKKNANFKFLLHNFDYSVSLANTFGNKEIKRFENSGNNKINMFKYNQKDFENGLTVYKDPKKSVGVFPLLRELSKNYFFKIDFAGNAANALFHYNSEYSQKTIKEIFGNQDIEGFVDSDIINKNYIELLESRIATIINENKIDPEWKYKQSFIEVNDMKSEIALYIRVVFHKYLYDKYGHGDKGKLIEYMKNMENMSENLTEIYRNSIYTINDYIHANINFINQLLDISFEWMIQLAASIKEEIENGS